jgi:hypothetical protein
VPGICAPPEEVGTNGSTQEDFDMEVVCSSLNIGTHGVILQKDRSYNIVFKNVTERG